MQVSDRIYGTFDIKEPVLVELIDSREMQRLKGIAQYGVPSPYYPFKGYDRFEHSVGVMLLLKKVNAPLEQQVAGLLHDVSHPAFSHTYDWVFGDGMKGNEDHQDNNHENYIRNSGIPEILERHGFDVAEVIDTKRHPLAERDRPYVCADRFDYSLRDILANPRLVQSSLDGLIARDGRLMFNSQSAAKDFGTNFMFCQEHHWGGTKTNITWYLFSQALKIALAKDYISKEDFWQNDAFVIKKLEESGDADIKMHLDALPDKFQFEIVEQQDPPLIKKKFRWVDPEYLQDGVVHTLSKTDPYYEELIEEQRKINEKGIKAKIEF